MTLTPASTDVEVALAAVAAGSAVVRTAYGGSLVRHAKTATDFTTNADIDAERAILDVIVAARPNDAFHAEEAGRSGGSRSSRRWLIDPLCGTLNFAAQTPLVAVNVALVDGTETECCVSADPIAGEAFWTDGTEAMVRVAESDAHLTPSAESLLVDINCDGPLDSPFLGPQLLADPAFRAMFGPRVTSTTLAVAWVAAGRRAGYISDGHLVDNLHFAAGIGLCRAAGCVVTDLIGGPLDAGRGLILAADTETHERLLALVAPHLDRLIN